MMDYSIRKKPKGNENQPLLELQNSCPLNSLKRMSLTLNLTYGPLDALSINFTTEKHPSKPLLSTNFFRTSKT